MAIVKEHCMAISTSHLGLLSSVAGKPFQSLPLPPSPFLHELPLAMLTKGF